MDRPLPTDNESQIADPKKGGWITFIFIAGAVAGTTIAGGGWGGNLIVYLIEEFGVKSINAAQIGNVVNGCIALFPAIGAIVADSVGCFNVITISSGIALLGTVLLFITAIPKLWSPSICAPYSRLCGTRTPSLTRFAILYAGIALASLGLGGTRFTLATMGADQHANSKSQDTFFNWYFFTFYVGAVLGATVLVYIEDNISWQWGFGLSIAANAFGFVIFLSGKRFYLHTKRKGSPFVALARVVIASIRKRSIPLSNISQEYYTGYKLDGASEAVAMSPTTSFRFLNRAAVEIEGDTGLDGSVLKPWRLCTVQQVEDLKSIVKMIPVWTTSIFIGTPIAIQATTTILQTLSMDRHVGPHFQIPAGSILVTEFIATAIALSVIDRFLLPAWQKLTGRYPTPFQRIGVGHILNVLAMSLSAMVEQRRLRTVHGPQGESSMLALWLVPQLLLVGVGEAFHFPGQVALYYQEFPTSMKNTATAMISMIIAISFYLGTFLISVVRRATGWLPDNINTGRIDNLYWLLAGVGLGNFCYFLLCAHFYKYQTKTSEGW